MHWLLKSLSLGLIFGLAGCVSTSQPLVQDYSQLEVTSQSKAVIFVKFIPEDPAMSTHMVRLHQSTLNSDGSVDDSSWLTKGNSTLPFVNLSPIHDYFVFVVEPTKKNETWYVPYIVQKAKNNPAAKNQKLVLDSCDGVEGLDNIKFEVSSPGVYDLGVISFGQKISTIGQISFYYKHRYATDALKNDLLVHFPSLKEQVINRLAPSKYVDKTTCYVPGPVTIYI